MTCRFFVLPDIPSATIVEDSKRITGTRLIDGAAHHLWIRKSLGRKPRARKPDSNTCGGVTEHTRGNWIIVEFVKALRLAQANELIAKIPQIRKDAEHNARQGFFRQGEVARLLAALPEDYFVFFGYLTGCHKGEVAKLEWRHIEGRVLRLPPAISKTKDGRVLVLAGELAKLIERRRVAQIDGVPWVFHRVVQGTPGTPVKAFYRSWKAALKEAVVPRSDFSRFAADSGQEHKPRQSAPADGQEDQRTRDGRDL